MPLASFRPGTVLASTGNHTTGAASRPSRRPIQKGSLRSDGIVERQRWLPSQALANIPDESSLARNTSVKQTGASLGFVNTVPITDNLPQ